MERKYPQIIIGLSLLFGITASFSTSANSTYSSQGISSTATPRKSPSKKDCELKGMTPSPIPDSGKVEAVSGDELSDELTPEEVTNTLKQMDTDKDGVCDYADNCEEVYNPKQEDRNKNGIGDACEPKRKAKVKKRKS